MLNFGVFSKLILKLHSRLKQETNVNVYSAQILEYQMMQKLSFAKFQTKELCADWQKQEK